MQKRVTGRNNQKGLPAMPQAPIRDNQGWSLASTLCMMLVISIFVGAMWSALLPVYGHLTNLRYKDAARSVNEGSMDAMLSQLNTQTLVGPNYGAAALVVTNQISQGGANYTVNTTLKNMGSGGVGPGGPPKNSVLYNANNPASNNFYLLTSDTTKAGLKRSLTVILNPINSTPNTTPWSQGGMFGVATVNEVGLAGVTGYNLPAGWTSPYQFADTTVAKGIHWQIGNGNLARSQVIAGSQFEFWHPGDSPPQQPPGTVALTYEPFTQIMGNVYSNYSVQNGQQGNGYWARNQITDMPAGAPNGDTNNANVFGAFNGGTLPSGQGVPTGFQSGTSNNSIPIPPTPNPNPTPPANGSGSSVNKQWGYNGAKNTAGTPASALHMPQAGTTDGGAGYLATPNTGGYITSPDKTTPAGGLDTWMFPAPPIPKAPDPPIGTPAPATGGLGVPNTTGTYYSNTAPNVVVQGTLNITSSATTIPATLSVAPGQTLNIPPGNYNLNSLQVVNGGKITVDPSVQGQTQLFLNPQGNGQGTNGALYVDNTSSINMTGITGGNGFTNSGISGFGPTLNKSIPAVNTSSPVQETSGSALNLVINSNASVNMLFAGNVRALVNAPNANVNIGYQPYNGTQYTPNSKTNPSVVMANDANFYGAVIGGNVSVVSDYQNGAGAYFHYDVKLKQMSNPQPGQAVTFNKPLGFYDPWTFANPGNVGGPAQGWRACSWQEQLGAW